MTTTFRRSIRLLVAAAAALVLPVLSQPAQAAQATAGQQMRDQLQQVPGGQVTGPTQITYGGGAFVIDFAPPAGARAVLAAPNCPSNWVCFYDGSNYTYPRGRLQACGFQDLARWGWRNRINSAHNHHGYSASIWDQENDYDGFVAEPGQAIPDVGTAKNKADVIDIGCG